MELAADPQREVTEIQNQMKELTVKLSTATAYVQRLNTEKIALEQMLMDNSMIFEDRFAKLEQQLATQTALNQAHKHSRTNLAAELGLNGEASQRAIDDELCRLTDAEIDVSLIQIHLQHELQKNA